LVSFIGYFDFVSEPSSEKAQKWFENNKGYFANLPEAEKHRLMKKKWK
jgi:hypothetical protein